MKAWAEYAHDADLLKEIYFDRKLRKEVGAGRGNASRSSVYRGQSRSVQLLEAEIVKLVRPALRLEI